MRTFSPKDPGETIVLGFNFAPDLNPGETLTGTPSVSVNILSGVDPAPAAMLIGSPSIVGNVVFQIVSGGVCGTQYGFSATCGTTNAQKFVEGGVLNIVQAYLM